MVPWQLGGPSDLSNLVLACSRHHHLWHQPGLEGHARRRRRALRHRPRRHDPDQPTTGPRPALPSRRRRIRPTTATDPDGAAPPSGPPPSSSSTTSWSASPVSELRELLALAREVPRRRAARDARPRGTARHRRRARRPPAARAGGHHRSPADVGPSPARRARCHYRSRPCAAGSPSCSSRSTSSSTWPGGRGLRVRGRRRRRPRGRAGDVRVGPPVGGEPVHRDLRLPRPVHLDRGDGRGHRAAPVHELRLRAAQCASRSAWPSRWGPSPGCSPTGSASGSARAGSPRRSSCSASTPALGAGGWTRRSR